MKSGRRKKSIGSKSVEDVASALQKETSNGVSTVYKILRNILRIDSYKIIHVQEFPPADLLFGHSFDLEFRAQTLSAFKMKDMSNGKSIRTCISTA